MAAEPRKAAACILVRGDREPEVLLARRNPKLRFMAGHHVFPGGRLDAGEDVSRVRGAEDEEHAVAVQAAAREVFEETGLMCVRGRLPDAEVRREARRAVLAEEAAFAKFLAAHELTIEAGDFEPAGEWLTPAFVPIRFSTRYYLHRVEGDQTEELIEGEIVGLDWFTAEDARQRWHAGELHLSTPVAYTLRQLASGLPEAVTFLQRGTERVPGEHNWFEIRRGITLVIVKSATIPPATHTNCVVVGEGSLFVVDPGADGEAEQRHLELQIDHLLELGGKVEGIVLSHSHIDHVSAAERLRERYDAPIMAHRATDEQVSFSVDRHLKDGEVIRGERDPRWSLECFHTPGHDPGHLCFYEPSTGALLAGDMVANPGTIVVSRQFGGDMDAFIGSLERLKDVPAKLIIPAHGHPAGRPSEVLQEHLDHRLWREAKIREAYEGGATTFEELLKSSYDDAPEAALPWARHALDAHLARLGIDLPAEY